MDCWEAGDRDFYLQQEACESDIWSGIFGNQGSKMSIWTEEHVRQREHSIEVQSKRLGGLWPNCNREARDSDKRLSEEGGGGTDWQLGGSRSSCREQHSGFCGLGKSSSRDVMWKGQAVWALSARQEQVDPFQTSTQEMVLTVSEIQKRRLILACPSVFLNQLLCSLLPI